MNGIFDKYKVEKRDGTPIDPKARYFVLRVDTDRHARAALMMYAESCQDENPQLFQDIATLLTECWPELTTNHDEN